MTLKSGTGQACAACKYQRRRCASDCPLAPYFPADQPKIFQNAHKLFGVSNMLKILRALDPSQQVIAMKSIKYQANMREKYPVYGCLVEIQQLYCQIQAAEEELQAVLAQLAFYRQQQQQQQQEISFTTDLMSQLQLGMAPPGNSLLLLNQENAEAYNGLTLPIEPHNYSSNEGDDGTYTINCLEDKDNDMENLLTQEPYDNSNNVGSCMAVQSQITASVPLSMQQEETRGYDEIHPFFDAIDDRQSYIDSKEVYASSSESSIKDSRPSIQQMAENELKSAAACFSLTSVN